MQITTSDGKTINNFAKFQDVISAAEKKCFSIDEYPNNEVSFNGHTFNINTSSSLEPMLELTESIQLDIWNGRAYLNRRKLSDTVIEKTNIILSWFQNIIKSNDKQVNIDISAFQLRRILNVLNTIIEHSSAHSGRIFSTIKQITKTL